MAAPRKLSAFRQLSLDCDERRKPALKKQLSGESDRFWRSPAVRPSSRALVKVAWDDEPVIVRRCPPVLRDASAAVDATASILAARHDVAEAKEPEKTNIEIYLAQDTRTAAAAPYDDAPMEPVDEPPRPPLVSTKGAALRDATAPTGRLLESNALVVVPVSDDAGAASRRRRFQKRTSSAFHEAAAARPPLVRSTSAPAHKPRPRRRLFSKKAKKAPAEPEHDEREPKGSDVVTMVSLISPEGSDAEDDADDGPDERRPERAGEEKREAEQPAVMSLRKTVKSVSFQQSSIHAVRSFSASFSARRASLMFGGAPKAANKNQEKRSTQHGAPDDDERVPKRRLVKCQQVAADSGEEKPGDSGKFAVSIAAKGKGGDGEEQEGEEEEGDAEPPDDAESQKERQCWSLYCKMTEKGINVSFDTILRGMLTPTEYRMSKMHHRHHHHHRSLDSEQSNS